jgi:sugar (pentulose or hexulose) kinase
VLDYEHRGPEALRPAYEALRPPFSATGSPALPMGLNLGAQLHWMLAQDAGLAARVAHVVTWPQFWGHRLTGEVACDLCSLGCHTDLWEPEAGRWSDLPARLGLAGRMAPPGRPGEVLGMLAPEVQAATGIGPVPVLVGIHDSNASLLPHLAAREPPFAVVSTGTWVIAMAVGGAPVTLDPARDTLVNVSAFGAPVPSARFMGGREHEMLLGPSPPEASEAEAAAVLARGVMLLPSVIPDSGPFQGRTARWTAEPQGADRSVAAGYYLGLMAAECLAQIGATGPSVVEGPLAANRWFRAMLATATGRAVEASEARTGTAVGAALLFAPAQARTRGAVTLPEPALQGYARAWRALAG